jgi:hypothetical protein
MGQDMQQLWWIHAFGIKGILLKTYIKENMQSLTIDFILS